MAREIKFRAWNTKANVMLSEFSVDILDKTLAPIANRLGWEQFVLMQFTGLRDKNGREIWEGDILQGSYNDTYDFARWQVVFRADEGRFFTQCIALHHKSDGFKDISRGGYCNTSPAEPKMEVVGNIYENPDLLEVISHSDV